MCTSIFLCFIATMIWTVGMADSDNSSNKKKKKKDSKFSCCGLTINVDSSLKIKFLIFHQKYVGNHLQTYRNNIRFLF